MTRFLGGPETPAKLAERHRRYLELNAGGETDMRAVVSREDGAVVGTIGLWDKDWQGETVYETGWAILPEHQGKGLATAATLAIIEIAREAGRHRWLHAFPSVENAASNALCQRVGFTNRGAHRFEYPKDHWMTCNDWALDLEG